MQGAPAYNTIRPRIFKNEDVLFNFYDLIRDNKHVLNYILNKNMSNIVK